MEMNVRDEKQLVEIWLTNAEKKDLALREGLKDIYDKYKKKKYLVKRICTRAHWICLLIINAAAPNWRFSGRRNSAWQQPNDEIQAGGRNLFRLFSLFILKCSQSYDTMLSVN